MKNLVDTHREGPLGPIPPLPARRVVNEAVEGWNGRERAAGWHRRRSIDDNSQLTLLELPMLGWNHLRPLVEVHHGYPILR